VPDTLVGRVVNDSAVHLPLYSGFFFIGGSHLPQQNFVTFGIGNGGRNPVAIFFIIPIFGLLGFWVRNTCWFIIQPIVGFVASSSKISNGACLVPVVRLGRVGVGDTSLVNPVFRLGIFGVINLLLRVDRWREVFEERSSLGGSTVDENLDV